MWIPVELRTKSSPPPARAKARDPWLLNGQEATEAAEPPEVATEATVVDVTRTVRSPNGRRDATGSERGGAGEVPVLFGWSVLVTTSKAPVTSSTAPVTTSVAPVTKKGRYMFQKVSKLKALDPMIRSFSFLGLPSPSPPTGSAPLAAAFRSGHRERVHAPSLGPTQRRGSREVAAPWTRRCPFKDATR